MANITLYPPQISGTIPAFSSVLKIPFVMNKAVSWNNVTGLRVRVRSIQNNALIYTGTAQGSDIDKDRYIAYFNITSTKKFQIGTSYKIQIAYYNEGITGFYSTVGVVKYTTAPKVEISGQDIGTLKSANNSYTGVYSQAGGDSSEKVYSYRFDIRNSNGDIVETSGDLIHNHEEDIDVNSSNDTYNIKMALEENKIYTIQYSIVTINGLEASTQKYRIIQQTTVDPEIKAKLIAELDEENGYVNLKLIGEKDKDGIEYTATGTFMIARSNSEDGYGSWMPVCRFALYGDAPSNYGWKDFTIQHGFDYKYSLQQYNAEHSIYSNRMLSNTITANFEHCFLFDGKRQLKIKFNPKVSSFKTTILEQKTNTLGGQYPFFSRNGNVNYKEFPISGLISYQMDEEELFLTNEDLLLDDYSSLTRQYTLDKDIKSTDTDYFYNMPNATQSYKLQDSYRQRESSTSNDNLLAKQKLRTTNLVDYNIAAERIFKLKVLDWLNDGQPKLFRSPGEGNYIVRLTGVSLTPNDQLNRMLHTFSATATEVDTYDYEKLNEYKFIEAEKVDIKQLRWKTVMISDLFNNTSNWVSIGSERNIQSIQCLDMAPGDKIRIKFANDYTDENEYNIQIGVTGAYYAEFADSPDSIEVIGTAKQGQITFSYYGTSLHHFDTYTAINMSDYPVKQFIGDSNGDILSQMQDIKYKVTKYNFLNFVKRPVEPLIEENTEAAKLRMTNELAIYYLNDKEYWDGKTKEKIDNYQCKCYVDGQEIDLTEIINYQLANLETLPEIVLTNGVALDISVQRREIVYDVESSDYDTIVAKQKYVDKLDSIREKIKPSEDIEGNKYEEADINKEIAELEPLYNAYIAALTKALKEKEVLDIE